MHHYQIETTWTGNLGTGTSAYRAYSRDHECRAPMKSGSIPGSADRTFRGDQTRYNPEELLVAALSACHMLTYLHLCADSGITVIDYVDAAEGSMDGNADGSGQFTEATLRPRVTITDAGRTEDALALHHQAHDRCFIARSVNFPVTCEPVVVARQASS